MRKIALVFAVFISLQVFVHAFTAPEKPTGHVNDYANLLSAEVKQQLEDDLRNFTASTSNEIAVVTIPDLGGDTIEHYATKLFETWKIGDEKNDNGVLLLISKDDRELRIEVGYGLEGALPDILAKDIIETKITTSFKNGNYNEGIVSGVKAIKEATEGEYMISKSSSSGNMEGIIPTILFFVVITFQFLSSIFARSKSWWAGGVVGGVVGVLLTVFNSFGITLLVGGIITVVLTLLGLLFDYIVSSTYTSSVSRGGGIPWWVGGNGFGGSGGGRSFGGFSGGSSGGGGASGRW